MNNYISIDDKKLKNQINRIIKKFRYIRYIKFFLEKIKIS